jgi:hypothetical protein
MESQGKILLHFDDDGDGTGKLLIQARSNGFSGEGGAWFSVGELQDFANAIAIFPLSKSDSPRLAGGFYKKDGSGELAEEHLTLTVYPIDSKGHLGIQVRIATELWNEARPESQHIVKLEIITSYEPLAQFSKGLKALIAGQSKELSLEGEQLP